MDLEEKEKKLAEEFRGLSKLLIKRTLREVDVNEDLEEARQKLQKFMKGPFQSNPLAGTDTKELRGSRNCPRVGGLSKTINSWNDEGDVLSSEDDPGDSDHTLEQSVVRGASAKLGLQASLIDDQRTPFQAHNAKRLPPSLSGQQTELVTELANRVSAGLTIGGRPKYLPAGNSEIVEQKPVIGSTTRTEGMERKIKAGRAPEPPKPKPKPNWSSKKQREHEKDCKESQGPSPTPHGQRIPPTPPPLIQSLPPPSGPPRKRLAPSPPPQPHEQTLPEEHENDCKGSRRPLPSPHAQPISNTSALRKQSWLPPSDPSRKLLAPLPPTPLHKESIPSLPPVPSPPPSPPPPPPPKLGGLPLPKAQPKASSPVLSNNSCLDEKDAKAERTREGDNASLKGSSDNEEDRVDLEEKATTLKEEFSSLPKVLIKKILCGDDIDGDLTKARQRLQEFTQLKDPGDRLKNSTAADLVTGKLNRDAANSSMLAGRGRYHYEEQNLREGGGVANLLPRNWMPMPRDDGGNDVTVHMVKLDSSSSEYQGVEERILETVNTADIMSIERIQNPYLYQSYQLLKQKMERNNGKSNERQLFHGTNPDNIKKINTQGFDRSFSGSAHGALYGSGVYFARDASYSIHYASKSSGGIHRVMYLARVLVGQYCRGQKSMRKPPSINPEQPEVLFDSMVDNMCDPSIFVIYYDSQSYPEYLISFF